MSFYHRTLYRPVRTTVMYSPFETTSLGPQSCGGWNQPSGLSGRGSPEEGDALRTHAADSSQGNCGNVAILCNGLVETHANTLHQ